MKFYFAPLEGITGYVYRNLYQECFGRIDKYFTPFIAPSPDVCFHPKELRDILPENNRDIPLVPQILTNRADVFAATARELKKMGYQEVNLNLGCPSRTVVSKGKGSGFLANPKELDAFFDQVFSGLDMKISVKTRIGKDSPGEFPALMEIYNRYPIHELIIHPRSQKDYYKNTPDRECFREAVRISKNPVCYNGDIFTAGDYRELLEDFPELEAVMMGRGLFGNPALVREIRGEGGLKKEELRNFHDRLLAEYQRVFQGDQNALFKMKEYWCYGIHVFSDNRKYAKKIRKAERMPAYLEAVEALFSEQELVPGAGFTWIK
ncbi:MAG: tRNA-dihydrouridine synthase family protein [Candidatus Limivivens sp.]|nr:tRNA-dihydrouridine synthase family protein [Candidatus Limivivens sp.]